MQRESADLLRMEEVEATAWLALRGWVGAAEVRSAKVEVRSWLVLTDAGVSGSGGRSCLRARKSPTGSR